MNKRKWLLLILCGILVWGYIKFFYKTYSTDVVAKSADCLIVLDVKRVTNTFIWNIITTPSQWKTPKLFSKRKDEVSWKNMVKIPDYVTAFHMSGQPANAWYIVLKIKDEKKFQKGLQLYRFENPDSNEYVSKEAGVHIFKNGNEVLVANAAIENKNYFAQAVNEVFIKKTFIAKATLDKAINAKSHLAIYIAANSFFQQEGIVTANFNKRKIEINGTLAPNTQYDFAQNNFSYSDSSLCTMGFTQPPAPVYALLSNDNKNNISKALSLNIDSLLLGSNKWYNLNIAAIKPRVDSAITYTYDDDFNKIEKVTANIIQEPAFNFTVTGDSTAAIYNHWLRSNKLEQTNAGLLFPGIPFVKSYCSNKGEKELKITAENYYLIPQDKTITCIFFLHISVARIPAEWFNYMPGYLKKFFTNIESLQTNTRKDKNRLLLHCELNKRDNNLPLIPL